MFSVLDLKLIAIAIISFGSYLFGVLPNILGLGTRIQNSVTVSSVLCFGGGVLFATSVIHILPDIRKDLSNWSEIVFCIGYLFMYFIDVIAATLSGNHNNAERECLTRENYRNYGSDEDNSVEVNTQSQVPVVNFSLRQANWLDLSLLIAFSLHSLLEGLVVGVESTRSGVLLLLTAVCGHKLLVAFCLGAELSSGGRPLYAILPALTVFVGGSSAGIGLGIVLQPDSSPVVGQIIPVLQGLAGGTLLYVVFTEILPRERSRKLPRYSAILQYFSLCGGFFLIACLSATM